MPAYRLLVPQSEVVFPTGNDVSDDAFVGVRVGTDGDLDFVGTDAATNTKKYVDYGNIFERLIPHRVPSDMQVKATDKTSTINDAPSSSFWLDGYGIGTGYDRNITDGSTLATWLDLSAGPHEWRVELNESAATMIARNTRLWVELQSTSLGWYAIWDMRLSIGLTGAGSDLSTPDASNLPR
jgi:hypothetical protein